ALIVYLWIATAPSQITDPGWFSITLAILLIAGITFVLPLAGMHRMLIEEKVRQHTQLGQRLESALAELHTRMEQGKLEDMHELKAGIDSLISERDMIEKVSTWPWQADTVRLMATALLLPLVLLITQQILSHVLGK